jgi:hypothetical protein
VLFGEELRAQELVKQTAKADPAHADIKLSEAALEKMKAAGARINVAIRNAEEQSKVGKAKLC